jgi:hypothetical protein
VSNQLEIAYSLFDSDVELGSVNDKSEDSLELFQFEKFVPKGRIDQSRLQGFRFLALALDSGVQLTLVFIVVGQSRVDLGQ